MMKSKKKHPQIRKELLLCTAIDIAIRHGYQKLTRDKIAKEAEVSTGLINKYFGTIAKLKKAVLKAAIEREIIEIIAQGLGTREPMILKASSAVKQKALDYMST